MVAFDKADVARGEAGHRAAGVEAANDQRVAIKMLDGEWLDSRSEVPLAFETRKRPHWGIARARPFMLDDSKRKEGPFGLRPFGLRWIQGRRHGIGDGMVG